MNFIVAPCKFVRRKASCARDWLHSIFRTTVYTMPLLALFTSACMTTPGDRAITVYGGRYTDNSLPEEILLLKSISYEDSWIAVAAYSEVFSKPVANRNWAYEGQVVKHSGDQDHWEYNALALHRWTHLEWLQPLRSSVAIGNGLSWATEIPSLEESSRTNRNATQLLYYLLLEVTIGLPYLENTDLVGRIHHRSGVLGLFDNVHGGSNIISLGFRHEF